MATFKCCFVSICDNDASCQKLHSECGEKTSLLERPKGHFTRRLFHLLKCQSPYGTPERRVATGVSRRLEKAGFRKGIFVKFHKKSIAGLPGDFDGPSGWVLLIRPLRTRSAPPLCTVPVFIYAGSISVHVVCSKFFLRWRRYPGVLGCGRPCRARRGTKLQN